MDNFNEQLQPQIKAAIAIQQKLLDKLERGCIPDDAERTTIDICSKIIQNSITINKFNELVNIDIDNEKYENYIKTLNAKDIKIY